MDTKFQDYTFDLANEQFTTLKLNLEKVADNKKYVDGDDWQNGTGWVGPQFTGTSEVSKNLRTEIQREFAAKGSIRAVIRRKTRGVSGRVPTWLISSRTAPENPDASVPTATKTLIEEASKILNEFWKTSKVHSTVKKFVEDYETLGHSVVRLFFVQTDSGEIEQIESIEKAVKKIRLFNEQASMGLVAVDKETLQKASFYRYEKDGNTWIEMCYIDDDGNTIFKTFSKDETKSFFERNLPTLGKYQGKSKESATDGLPLPLNEKLLLFQLTGRPLISPAMKTQQKILNKALTMLSHNLDEDGFRSRVLLNALPPGEFEKDSTGKKVFVPNEKGLQRGAGTVNYVNGLPVIEKNADGTKQTYLTPNIFESQPIDVKTFIDSADTASECILEEADQKHISISGNATASGESRKEAREEYKQSLEDTKTELDDEMSDVFECVLSVVSYLMGSPGKYDELQVSYSSILNPGPISSDERRTSIEEADKGYRSRESAMELIGITDPEAMKAKIKQEQEENPQTDPNTDPNKKN
jgi:hypothetical protein